MKWRPANALSFWNSRKPRNEKEACPVKKLFSVLIPALLLAGIGVGAYFAFFYHPYGLRYDIISLY